MKEGYLTTQMKNKEKFHGAAMVIITDLFLLLSLLNSVSFFLPPLTFWWCGSIFLLFIWCCVESTSTFKKKNVLRKAFYCVMSNGMGEK